MNWGQISGSIAGSLFGSAIQGSYNSAAAKQQNEWNVENYKHRYQWAMEDMRQAGLNPILAATNGIGGSISGASAASISAPDISGNLNSAESSRAANRQAKTAENLSISQIEKNIAESDLTRNKVHGQEYENGILANEYNLKEQTYEDRLAFERQRMKYELDNLRRTGNLLEAQSASALASVLSANSSAAYNYERARLERQEADWYDSFDGSSGSIKALLGLGHLLKG